MIRKTVGLHIFVLLLLLLIATLNATAGTFDFGGSCPSRGEWTRRALEQTGQITAAFRQLKDDPNCKGLEGAITNLQSAAVQLDNETPNDSESTQARIESLPGEIDILKGAVLRGGEQNASAIQMLATRNIEAASINSSLQQDSILNGAADLVMPGTGKKASLDRMLKRLAGPVNKGLTLITNVMQELPKYDECLIGQPAQGMAVIAGAIKVAGAYSASGEGVADKLGNAIAGLMTMLQQRKFTQVLRAQNQTEFWQSISCLLETTTKNYCDAENAQEVLLYSKTQYQNALNAYESNHQDPNYDNPLEGYYLLVRELPIIANWLQQVTFGVTPKLSTDATFKNRVWDETVEQIKNMNMLYGYFNEQMLYVNGLKDDKQKRNHLVTMLEYITGVMGGGSMEGSGGSKFFTTSISPQLLPFYLIGRDSIPLPCLATGNNIPMDSTEWMRTNGNGGGFVDDFSNPAALAETIKMRMNQVIEDATVQAGEYFRQRMVVDVTELVDRTLSSQYLTVKKAFESVNSYLVRFENKLKQTDDDLDVMMISSVRETKMRVQRFLKSYQKRHELGMKVKKSSGQDAILQEQLKLASEAVIDSAFTEFNALFQKNVFLTNRLNTYIKRDFAMRVKKSLNMSAHQQDILTISQENLLDTLQQVHGVDPTSAQLDLATAQLVNKRNIDSLSAIFTDTMYRMMVDFKATVNGTGAAGVKRMLEAKHEKQEAALKRKYESGDGIYSWNINGFYFMPYVLGVMPNYYKIVQDSHPDLYSATASVDINVRDSKFGDVSINLAKACVQTLAFENRSFFIDLCMGSVLPSFYAQDTIDKKSLDVKYDEYVSYIRAPLVRRNPVLTSKNICAFNNFKINNLVQYLRDQDKQTYQDAYSTPY